MTPLPHTLTSDPDDETLYDPRLSVGDPVEATAFAPLVLLGRDLGLYEALADIEPLTPAALALRTGLSEGFVREWLRAHVVGGYVAYHPETDCYTLTDEQALLFAYPDSPAYIVGFFETALAATRIAPSPTEAFHTDKAGDHRSLATGLGPLRASFPSCRSGGRGLPRGVQTDRSVAPPGARAAYGDGYLLPAELATDASEGALCQESPSDWGARGRSTSRTMRPFLLRS